jgi:hypothetical protein
MQERSEGGPHGVDLEWDVLKDAFTGRKSKIAIRIVRKKDGRVFGTCADSSSCFVWAEAVSAE